MEPATWMAQPDGFFKEIGIFCLVWASSRERERPHQYSVSTPYTVLNRCLAVSHRTLCTHMQSPCAFVETMPPMSSVRR